MFDFQVMGMFWNEEVVMVAQHCECTSGNNASF